MIQIDRSQAETKEEREREVAQEAGRIHDRTRFRRQRLFLGVGALDAHAWEPFASFSWQLVFRPKPPFSQFLTFPFELQLHIPPSGKGYLAGASGGARATLAPLDIPVSVHLFVGGAFGKLPGMERSGTENTPLVPIFGPTFGIGAGWEHDQWRFLVRWEYLHNILSAESEQDEINSVNALFARFGWSF